MCGYQSYLQQFLVAFQVVPFSRTAACQWSGVPKNSLKGHAA